MSSPTKAFRALWLAIEDDEESQAYENVGEQHSANIDDEWNEIISRNRSDQDKTVNRQEPSRWPKYPPLAPPSGRTKDRPKVKLQTPTEKEERRGRTRSRSQSVSRSTTSGSDGRGNSLGPQKRSRSIQVARTRSSPSPHRYRSKSCDVQSPGWRGPKNSLETTQQQNDIKGTNGNPFAKLRRLPSNNNNTLQEEEDDELRTKVTHIRCLGHGSTWTSLALAVSWIGVAFAFLGRQNLNFVKLKEPWRIAPIYEDVSSIGIINARLCYNESVSTLIDPDDVGCFTIPLATNEDIDDPIFKVAAIFVSVATLSGTVLSIFLTSSIIWRTINFRALGTGYLLVYCFQSLSFLFFDTDICDAHECRVDTGCIYSIIASLFWITACLLCAKMDANRVRSDLSEERKKRKGYVAKKAAMMGRQSNGTVTTERTSSTYSDEFTVDFDEEIALPLTSSENNQWYSAQQFDMCNVGGSLGLPVACNDDLQCNDGKKNSRPVKRHSTGTFYPQQDLNKFIKTPTNRPSDSNHDGRDNSFKHSRGRSKDTKSRGRRNSRPDNRSRPRSIRKVDTALRESQSQHESRASRSRSRSRPAISTRSQSKSRREDEARSQSRNREATSHVPGSRDRIQSRSRLETRARSQSQTRTDCNTRSQSQPRPCSIPDQLPRSSSRTRSDGVSRPHSLSRDGGSYRSKKSTRAETVPKFQSISRDDSLTRSQSRSRADSSQISRGRSSTTLTVSSYGSRTSRELKLPGDEKRFQKDKEQRIERSSKRIPCRQEADDVTEYWRKIQQTTLQGDKNDRPRREQYEVIEMSSPGLSPPPDPPAISRVASSVPSQLQFVTSFFDI